MGHKYLAMGNTVVLAAKHELPRLGGGKFGRQIVVAVPAKAAKQHHRQKTEQQDHRTAANADRHRRVAHLKHKHEDVERGGWGVG